MPHRVEHFRSVQPGDIVVTHLGSLVVSTNMKCTRLLGHNHIMFYFYGLILLKVIDWAEEQGRIEACWLEFRNLGGGSMPKFQCRFAIHCWLQSDTVMDNNFYIVFAGIDQRWPSNASVFRCNF